MNKPPPKLNPRPKDPDPPKWAKDPDRLLKSSPGRIRAALTGGIASGKSTVAALLEAFGAKIIDFDILSREALTPFTPTWEKTLELFGPKAKLPDNQLDRPFLAKKIFKDKNLRLALEDIVHPFTWIRMLEDLEKEKDLPLIVMDIPLLYEVALHSLFNPVILCFASPGTQIRRLIFRNPELSTRTAKKILLNQLPITEKLRHANIVLNNDGSMKDLIRQTSELHKRLTDKNGLATGCLSPLIKNPNNIS
jgi:dephospho-CoA kinase